MKIETDSFMQIDNEFFEIASKKMEPEEQLIYLHVSRFCYGAKKTAFPSQQTIANLTGYSLRKVVSTIGLMVKNKIFIVVSKSSRGKAKLNTYQVATLEQIKNMPDLVKLNKSNSVKTEQCANSVKTEQCANSVKTEQCANSVKTEQCANYVRAMCKLCKSNVHGLHMNNTNRIILSNNTNLDFAVAKFAIAKESDKSDKSKSTDFQENKGRALDKNLQMKKNTDKSNLPNTDKPESNLPESDLPNTDLPNTNKPESNLKNSEKKEKTYLTAEEVKTALRNWFVKNVGVDQFKHTKNLLSLNKPIDQLQKGLDYLKAGYWSIFKFGDGSLSMFAINFDEFIKSVDDDKLIKQTTDEFLHQDELIEQIKNKFKLFEPTLEKIEKIEKIRAQLKAEDKKWFWGSVEQKLYMQGKKLKVRGGKVWIDEVMEVNLNNLSQEYMEFCIDSNLKQLNLQ